MSAIFPPDNLPLPGEILLVTDELLASANFLLYRFLLNHVKQSADSISILVSVSEDTARWKSIAGRLVSIEPCVPS